VSRPFNLERDAGGGNGLVLQSHRQRRLHFV